MIRQIVVHVHVNPMDPLSMPIVRHPIDVDAVAAVVFDVDDYDYALDTVIVIGLFLLLLFVAVLD
jgi:hypothetical protein